MQESIVLLDPPLGRSLVAQYGVDAVRLVRFECVPQNYFSENIFQLLRNYAGQSLIGHSPLLVSRFDRGIANPALSRLQGQYSTNHRFVGKEK